MELNPLQAISPLDGRYRHQLAPLATYFSEWALIKYRIKVEIEYFIALTETGIKPLSALSSEEEGFLRDMVSNFSEADGLRVKAIEKITNHDVKAVEYFIKEKIDEAGMEGIARNKEFIHFGLTSQDINNTAIPMGLRDAMKEVYLPGLAAIIEKINAFATEWRQIPMLARTHGQAASPTGLGKEMKVFAQRLQNQFDLLHAMQYPAKFGGATGNMNAHYIAYPNQDWRTFADQFVDQTLGLSRSFPTTQIEHYDGLAQIFDGIKRVNGILTDFCQDIWIYVSMEYFRQKVKAGEVGSSAMPHKVNPIDFENAEGNSGLSTALLEFLSRKLPVSRLQRDLTDSTILRNLGVALGYAVLAQKSLQKGMGKLLVNEDAIARDLQNHWAVLAEAIQTILRREAYPNPYEALRDLTRGNANINAESLKAFIEQLDVTEAVKQELLQVRPETYIGDAAKL